LYVGGFDESDDPSEEPADREVLELDIEADRFALDVDDVADSFKKAPRICFTESLIISLILVELVC